MATAAGAVEDPAWAEIARMMVPLPDAPYRSGGRVFVLAGSYSQDDLGDHDEIMDRTICQWCGTLGCDACKAQPPGSMDVATWPIWPAEVINLASPAEVLETARQTLVSTAPWEQGNSFCSVRTARSSRTLNVAELRLAFGALRAPLTSIFAMH